MLEIHLHNAHIERAGERANARSGPINGSGKGNTAVTKIQILYDGPIVKRADAKHLGLRRYFTGYPCKCWHVSQRYINGNCVECHRVYSINLYHNDYENQKSIRDASRSNNIDRHNSYNRNWFRKNKEKRSSYEAARRAKIAKTGGFHTADDVSFILIRQKWRCAEPTCETDLKKSGYHVDHIMPLALGGSNWPENLQCLCQRCNNRKHAKHPIEWARENGRLL